jgi:hypothetical protein
MAHPEPHRARPARERAFGDAQLDQVVVAHRADAVRKDDRRERLRRPQCVRRRRRGNVDLRLALRDGGEARHFASGRAQARREVRHVAADVLGGDVDFERADRHRPHEVRGEAREMPHAEPVRRARDGARGERHRGPAVLVSRVPRAARELGRIELRVARHVGAGSVGRHGASDSNREGATLDAPRGRERPGCEPRPPPKAQAPAIAQAKVLRGRRTLWREAAHPPTEGAQTLR